MVIQSLSLYLVGLHHEGGLVSNPPTSSKLSLYLMAVQVIYPAKIANITTIAKIETVLLPILFNIKKKFFNKSMLLRRVPCVDHRIDPQIQTSTSCPKALCITNIQRELLHSKTKIGTISESLWRKWSRLMNPYETVPNICSTKSSRAYFKLFEILQIFEPFIGLKDIRTMHICEAPGGFVEATCDILKGISHKWIVQSKNGNSRNIPKINVNLQKRKNGKILTSGDGDILNPDTITHLTIQGEFDMVTGDGGFDVSIDYRTQEQQSFKLIYAEVVVSINLLKKGGCMILKMFDTHTLPTIQLVYWISSMFESVWFIKPKNSRPANGERYLVALKFKKQNPSSIVNLQNINYVSSLGIDLSTSFLDWFKAYNEEFSREQLEFIESTMNKIAMNDMSTMNFLINSQRLMARSYCDLLKLK